ncbi:sigma-54-dependent transcriptional regulator [Pseudazoarcus pumilus]|uniref:Sigma-54-dependent Fis family transcriptional regulator n=1 Tax=Pseudazoarcus pumilus TaxID=2067960 RepID=A0A2I6S3P2_9RHOO|nr:sigma-54 dependent transcriptional regulator [Pseudazoarcus pumilus]AUN93880.1 sigma-54-dependent Fis family transcriptional regulator [Pseudazoarcus pumilus]
MNAESGARADVLVIDDEADIRELLELALLRMGLSCDTAGSVAEARERLASGSYRLCLTDMRLPDGDGLDLVAYIQQAHAGLPVAVISAHGSIDTAIRALKLGAFDFVTKPVEVKAVRALVEHALRVPEHAQDEPEADGVRRLIGRSAAIEHLRAQVARLARSQAPVFIHGESGTGKEVIARSIHALGPRAGGAFVPVNCGAIPHELMESEFFGHVRGSFSGATADKPGLFRAAQGGTLFLDEVAELPLAMQVKLLRAIQERAVRPVGAHAEEAVDVRVLSASHRDLAALVAEGRFRQDLFYRINVIALHVPPLRERPEDIEALAAHILARLAARDGGPAQRLSAESLAALRAHPFPGNVRELENLLERACALCDSDVITPADLALDAAPAPLASPVTPPPGQGGDDERSHILRALEETRWNRSEAARRLGMTLRQLRYRLQKWGME